MYGKLKKGLSKSARSANKAGKIKDPFADIMLKVGKDMGVFKSAGGKIKGYSAGGKVTATNYKSCGANIIGTK